MAHLYFRQLLAGVDFARENFAAKKMENFVYLIGDKDTKECLVVDPAWNVTDLVNIAQKDGMKITGALATHYHPDHVGGEIFGFEIDGLPTLMQINPCKVHAHKLEAEGICKVTGVSTSDIIKHDSGDIVKIGAIEIELLHTPGHTPGSMCFRLKDSLVSGDTLFLNGCGRVDLPGSNVEDMYYTITQRLNNLPSDMILYPGHAYGGKSASMNKVQQNNFVMQIKDLAAWKSYHGR